MDGHDCVDYAGGDDYLESGGKLNYDNWEYRVLQILNTTHLTTKLNVSLVFPVLTGTELRRIRSTANSLTSSWNFL